ncbi:hypothetical protein [Caballeronia grimmiae]|uniref:hypothetical protein n=1 Tax=Caballeronia grimmiae TaxID=1071679 RepID=UPI0038BCFA2C
MKVLLSTLWVWLLGPMYILHAHSTVRYDELWYDDLSLFRRLIPSVVVQPRSVYGDMLLANGVDPNSEKGRLIVSWIARINHDIAIAQNVRRRTNAYFDPVARSELLADALSRLSPSLRLQYVQLISKFLDTLVPLDCFGSNEVSDVVNHIPLSAISEVDIDAYFRLLSAALHGSWSDVEQRAPSPEALNQAEALLRRSLLHQLNHLPANVSRYGAYAENPGASIPIDACWAMRVTMHAILALPDPERDIILRRTVQSPQVSP